MSGHDGHSQDPRDPRESRVADAIRGLSRPAASAAFRQSLKADFVSGAIDEIGVATAGTLTATGDEHAIGRGRDTSFWPLLRLAVAAGVVVLLGQWLNAGPSIHIAVPSSGALLVNGVEVAASEADLRGGSALTVNTADPLELLIDGVALFEVAPGTRMTVPTSPGRWFGRRGNMSVDSGEVRFLSGADFAGATYEVTTPDGRVEINGTLLSVQCDDVGTCVCVLEGEAWVGVDAGHMEPVRAGTRKVMPREGESFLSPVKPMHADGVVRFEAEHGNLIR